jgi:hypothetical protein
MPMGRLLTTQQLRAKSAAKKRSGGLVLVKKSHIGRYLRDSKEVLIQAPSGLYRNSQNSVDLWETARDTINTGTDEDASTEKSDESAARPLTKKEKQAIRWLEGVQYMIPWYLETLRATEGLSRVDEIHNLPSRCADCEWNGKGINVLCLLFTRMWLHVLVKI